MYKRILCPIDGSSTSNYGMLEAINLAKDQQAKLCFLHVIDTYIPVMDATGDLNLIDIKDILLESGKKILNKANETAQMAGVISDSETLEADKGQIAKAIIIQINAWRADLVVMGTHGLRGIERLVIGSDAETVIRTSPVPVLVLRGKDIKLKN